MGNMLAFFKVILIVSLFYSGAITGLSYALPSNIRNYVVAFSEVGQPITLNSVTGQVRETLERQNDIPLIELGALVFFSGNIILDFLLNFSFALPQMLGLIINGIMQLINVDSFIGSIIQAFASAVVLSLYFIGLIQLLTNVRSRGSVI